MQTFSTSRLPYDILWQIIEEVWLSPLSISERVHCMTSFELVNKTWSDIFARISSKDAHIPCPSYFERYMYLVHDSSFRERSTKRNDMCRSITVTIEPTSRQSSPTTKLLSDLFHGIKFAGAVPQLKTVHILYTNVSADDVFDCFQFIHFPPQVRYLHVDIDSCTYTKMCDGTRRSVNPPWYLPQLQWLSLSNANEDLVTSFLQSCHQLNVLETDFFITELGAFLDTKYGARNGFLYRFQPCCSIQP